MGAGHGHAHSGAAGGDRAGDRGRSRLAVALGLALVVLVVELVGGLLAGSVALLADAVHVGTDAGALALSLFAATMAARPATLSRTFGWQRLEVLAAAVNGVVLLAAGAWVLVESVLRLRSPAEVSAGTMLAAAVLGMAANGVGLLVLSRGGTDSLNLRAAYLEVLTDLLGAGAVAVAAAVIALTGARRVDAVVGIGIALAIAPRTWRLLREALDVLLEATPRDVDLGHVREHVLAVPGVVDVHDLHAWTITSGLPVVSAHVVVEDRALDAGHGAQVLDQLGECLAGHFDVAHCTFQLEPAGHREHEPDTC